MQCINCNSEINGVALVCPFCHTNPGVADSAPYSGIAPTPPTFGKQSNGPGIFEPGGLFGERVGSERDNAIYGNGSLVAWLFGWGKKEDKKDGQGEQSK
jgi:hypothetical protein